MEPSYGGHNYSSYMSDMYHSHNAQGAMPTPMVPSRSGAPGWPHMPLQQHEFMMAANTMEDKKPWGHISSVGDPGHLAPGKDADKQASKRSRMSTRDDQPSETSSHGDNGTGGGQSSTAGSISNSLLPVWELATVLGPGAASLHSGRRSSSIGADRGRSEVDTLAGSKDSSESQEDSEDDGEDGDDKPKDKSKQQLNRKAAQLSRRRKKERISELEQNVINLSRRNHELKVINDTLRTLLNDRSKQQSENEHRIMHLLRSKNHQLKQALHELQAHSRGNAELPHSIVMSAAALLGPDFQFQQLGVLPPLAPPPSPAASNAYMGVMPQQYGAGSMFPGVDGLPNLSTLTTHDTTFSHPLQPQNRNMGMNMPPMMMSRQMGGGMEMGMGSFLRPPHGQQPGMRHELDGFAAMAMNRMPGDQQDLPGIVQSTKL